jgi:hypothetical protein
MYIFTRPRLTRRGMFDSAIQLPIIDNVARGLMQPIAAGSMVVVVNEAVQIDGVYFKDRKGRYLLPLPT